MLLVALATALPSEDVLLDKIAEVGRSMHLTEAKQDRAQRLFVWRVPVPRVGPQDCATFFAWSIQREDDRSIMMYDPALGTTSCLHGVAQKDVGKAANKVASHIRDIQAEFKKRFAKLVGPVEYAAVSSEMMQTVMKQLSDATANGEHK